MTDSPKIAFIIPLASSRVVTDWHLTSLYLSQTLRSIFNSTSNDFCVVVAGHEVPDFALPVDNRFKFLPVIYAIPPKSDITYYDKVHDKMTKLAAAWDFAKKNWNPQYVMKVDADDLLSSKLVAWLVSAKSEAGFCANLGWHWNSGSRFMQYTEKFDELCGTCLIIRNDLADLNGPFFINSDAERNRIIDHKSLVPSARTSTLLLNDCHHRADAQFRLLGYTLARVPFRAAVYRQCASFSLTDHRLAIEGRVSESRKIHSFRWLLGRIRRTRLITRQLRREFMLP